MQYFKIMRVSSVSVYLNMLVILSFSLSDTPCLSLPPSLSPSLSVSLSISLYYMLYIFSGVPAVVLIVKYALWLVWVIFTIFFVSAGNSTPNGISEFSSQQSFSFSDNAGSTQVSRLHLKCLVCLPNWRGKKPCPEQSHLRCIELSVETRRQKI